MVDYITVGLESSYGGGAATHTPVLVTNVEDNVNRGIEVFGNVDEYKKGYVKTGKLVVNGSFTASLRPNMLKDVLVAAFGSGSGVGGYYKVGLGAPKSLEMRVSTSGVVKSIVGVGIIKTGFAFVSNKLAEVKVDWIARDYSLSDEESVTYSEEDPALPYLCTITFTRDGTPVVKENVKTLSMEVTFGLDGDYFVVDDYRLAGLIRKDVVEMVGSVELSGVDLDEVASILVGDVSRTSMSDNKMDVIGVKVDFLNLSGTPKVSLLFDVTYESLASGLSKGSRQRTWKFRNCGEDIEVRIY